MNTDRMSCGEAREKLPLFVGGDLDREVLDAVREHLDACGDCARRAAQATRARRELVAAFHSAELDSKEPELWPGIRAVLRREGRIRDPLRATVREREDAPSTTIPAAATESGPRRARWAWALAPIAAAAAVLAIVELSGLSTGKSVPPELAPQGGELVVDRDRPDAPDAPEGLAGGLVPVSGGLQPVSAEEPWPMLDPFERRPRIVRVQEPLPGGPIFQVGLKYK